MQKYAVYKTETGQYCYRYADSLQQLSGTGFEDLVREDQLPIVLDDRGGYFQFDPNDHHFVEVIESDKKFPLPLDRMFKHNDPAFQLGWISPDGETYSLRIVGVFDGRLENNGEKLDRLFNYGYNHAKWAMDSLKKYLEIESVIK